MAYYNQLKDSVLACIHCGFEQQSLAYYALLAATLLLPLSLALLMKFQQSKGKLPPSPPGAWPIVGHLPLLGKQPHLTMVDLANEYGDIFALRLGSVPAIVVSSPAMAREVLQTQDKVWASRPTRKISAAYFSYNYRGIAFAQYTPMWRQLRKIATVELFTARRLEASHGMREEEMRHMICSIMQDVRAGAVVDVKLKLNAMVANEIFRMVLNHRFSGSIKPAAAGSVEQEAADAENREFRDMINELQQLKGLFMLGDYVPWLRPLDIGGIERRMKALQGRLDAFLNKVVEEHAVKHRQGPVAESDMDMVDVLLQKMLQQDQETESEKLDLETIKAIVMSMIAAGVDTSTVTVEWGMSELIRNPDVLRKLTAELDEVVGKERMVRETDIPNLKYLQAVVKEVFRLHPPAPLLIPHESIQDCELAGYHVRAGTRLFVHVHAIGRSAAVWDSPLEFIPERFMSGAVEESIDVKGQDFRLLPFGSGRRACPAITLGTISVQWPTAMLVHAFDWSLPAGESFKDLDMTKEFGITTPRANALLLRAIPRLSAHLYSA